MQTSLVEIGEMNPSKSINDCCDGSCLASGFLWAFFDGSGLVDNNILPVKKRRE
jgi:hypothetical protein